MRSSGTEHSRGGSTDRGHLSPKKTHSAGQAGRMDANSLRVPSGMFLREKPVPISEAEAFPTGYSDEEAVSLAGKGGGQSTMTDKEKG